MTAIQEFLDVTKEQRETKLLEIINLITKIKKYKNNKQLLIQTFKSFYPESVIGFKYIDSTIKLLEKNGYFVEQIGEVKKNDSQ